MWYNILIQHLFTSHYLRQQPLFSRSEVLLDFQCANVCCSLLCNHITVCNCQQLVMDQKITTAVGGQRPFCLFTILHVLTNYKQLLSNNTSKLSYDYLFDIRRFPCSNYKLTQSHKSLTNHYCSNFNSAQRHLSPT